MGVERTEQELRAAEYNFRGCEGHLHRSIAAWRQAQAADSSNKLYYRLRRTHGDNYRQKLKDAYESALREFDDARERLEKARRAQEEPVATSHDRPASGDRRGVTSGV